MTNKEQRRCALRPFVKPTPLIQFSSAQRKPTTHIESFYAPFFRRCALFGRDARGLRPNSAGATEEGILQTIRTKTTFPLRRTTAKYRIRRQRPRRPRSQPRG